MPADEHAKIRGTSASRPVPAEPARLAPGLYVVATPIGNLSDVTLRALDTLGAADLVLCEDTRVTRKLFTRYSIKTSLLAYHDHNADMVRPRVLAKLAEGAAVALVSDAGTPLVSDPGYKLVAAALDAGHRVFPVPGASAVLAALVAAGLPSDRFLFDGYLPAKVGQRRTRIEELAAIPATLILYETGPRLAASLAALSEILGARPASVCRELTKLYEEIRLSTLDTLAAHYATAGRPKGEIVIVIGPPEEHAPDADDLDARIEAALARSSLKDAVASVTAETGLKRKQVYARALALAGKGAK